MESLVLIMLAGGAWPLWVAWRATATTTLRPSLAWAGAAWAVWLAALATGASWTGYLALSLSGCAGIAVLGGAAAGDGGLELRGRGPARRLPAAAGPGVRDAAPGNGPRDLSRRDAGSAGAKLSADAPSDRPCCCAALAVRPTGAADRRATVRLAGGRLARLPGRWSLGGTAGPARAPDRSKVEYTWLRFRDGYGFIWGQAALEQFNRAAANAGWTTRLTWRGFDRPTPKTPSDDELLLTLTAVLKALWFSVRSPRMPTNQQSLLTRAVQHYQAGTIAEAEALCLQIVRGDPRQAEAWNLLGAIAPARPASRRPRSTISTVLGQPRQEHRLPLQPRPGLPEARAAHGSGGRISRGPAPGPHECRRALQPRDRPPRSGTAHRSGGVLSAGAWR